MDRMIRFLDLEDDELQIINDFRPVAERLREHARAIDLEPEGLPEWYRDQLSAVENELKNKLGADAPSLPVYRPRWYPEEFMQELKEVGIFGAGLPEQYGGIEFSYWQFILMSFGLSYYDAGFSVVMGAHAKLATPPILDFGTDEQKQHFVPALASGERIGCFALTGPETGSNPSAGKCSYEHGIGGFVLNGGKAWISNAPIHYYHPDQKLYATTFARDSDGKWSCFVVDVDEAVARGQLEIGKPEHKVGIRSSPTSAMYFKDCVVPEENLIGEEGAGLLIAFNTLNRCRLFVAAQALAIGYAAYDEARDFVQDRSSFGRLADNGLVRKHIADMATKLRAGVHLVKDGSKLLDTGRTAQQVQQIASEAKVYSTEMAEEVCLLALKLHGGNGITMEYDVNRHLRDILVTTIYEGPNDVLRQYVIATQAFRD